MSTTKVNWLLDADMFDHYRDQLIAVIRQLGHDVKLIHAPKPGFSWDDEGCSYRNTFPPDACVIVHGDIDLVRRVYREQRWMPGVFATIANFDCSCYFAHFGRHLLNRDYVMLPFAELDRRRDFLFDTLGVNDAFFVRPNSPLKLFTGRVARRDSYDGDLELMGFYDFPRDSLVVVSSPKQILTEWRFVVADRRVVAGCRYSRAGRLDPDPACDPNAFDLAQTIASADWQPDPVWVMDVCQTGDGAYHLLEIGAFSFADLYECDKRAVVSAVSAAAIEVWNSDRAAI